MFRNLAGNLVLHERLETTDAKAKELRRIAERLMSKALRLGDSLIIDVGKLKTPEERETVIARRMHAQRLVASFLPKKMTASRKDGTTEEVDLVYKLFHEIAPRFLDRVKAGKGGGYTRITKALIRRGDNAPMSIIEFLPTAEGAAGGAPKATEAKEAKDAEPVTSSAKEKKPKAAKVQTAETAKKPDKKTDKASKASTSKATKSPERSTATRRATKRSV